MNVNQVQNINCQTFDRVPPLHQHMPQDNNIWPNDEVARKKAKIVKNSYKKQRQHSNNMNCNLDQGLTGDEINSQSGKLSSVFNISVTLIITDVTNLNNLPVTGPSFLEDPSGYLAQQTALLNSTISRQTGVTSSQLIVNNNGLQQQQGNSTYLPQPKPSSLASPTSLYSKNNPTESPVHVHSSMTPNSAGSITDSEGGSPMSCVTQRCADTLSSSNQDSYKQRNEMHRHQYTILSDAPEDVSSTLGDKCLQQQSSCQQQMLDSRPIQGGTVSTSHGSPIGTNSPANSDCPTSSTSQPATPQSLISSQPPTPHAYSQPATPHMSAQQTMNEQRSATPLNSMANDPNLMDGQKKIDG